MLFYRLVPAKILKINGYDVPKSKHKHHSWISVSTQDIKLFPRSDSGNESDDSSVAITWTRWEDFKEKIEIETISSYESVDEDKSLIVTIPPLKPFRKWDLKE